MVRNRLRDKDNLNAKRVKIRIPETIAVMVFKSTNPFTIKSIKRDTLKVIFNSKFQNYRFKL